MTQSIGVEHVMFLPLLAGYMESGSGYAGIAVLLLLFTAYSAVFGLPSRDPFFLLCGGVSAALAAVSGVCWIVAAPSTVRELPIAVTLAAAAVSTGFILLWRWRRKQRSD